MVIRKLTALNCCNITRVTKNLLTTKMAYVRVAVGWRRKRRDRTAMSEREGVKESV